MSELESLRQQHAVYVAKGLSLNMERGQPSEANLDLGLPLLDAVGAADYMTDSGIDIRNYPGGILGLKEARELFSEQLRVSPDQMIVGNSSSLELMSSFLSWALLKGVRGSTRGWIHDKPKMLVTVPGYDRHFSLAEGLGYELVPVAIDHHGPNLEQVEGLLADDDRIKGIFFVPTYSNPTGDSISAETARRLINVKAAASDFTIFADDAYAIHHLHDNFDAFPNLLEIATDSGQEDRVILFGSTSKVTFASAGICFAGMSLSNVAHWSKQLSVQSIGPNKAEQWRHVRFLRNFPGGLRGLMCEHAKILKPKFDLVEECLSQSLGNQNLASWSTPKGGYFVSVDTRKPVAKRVVELAAEAGVSLTPCGATFPGGIDPDNTNIRLAPSRPGLAEVASAMEVFVCCVKLASAEFDARS